MFKKVLSQIPNLLTAANLFCGLLALDLVFHFEFKNAAYLVLLAALFDFFDGFAARLLSVQGEFGKQLDSLADVVTFGVVPSFMLVSIQRAYPDLTENQEFWIQPIVLFVPFLIAVFSALRLARFNTKQSTSKHFIGLPTPANALFIISIPFMLEQVNSFWFTILTNTWFLAVFSVFSCFLLYSNIQLLSLKVSNLSWKENQFHFALFAIALLSVFVFKFAAMFYVIPAYIIISLIQNITHK